MVSARFEPTARGGSLLSSDAVPLGHRTISCETMRLGEGVGVVGVYVGLLGFGGEEFAWVKWVRSWVCLSFGVLEFWAWPGG